MDFGKICKIDGSIEFEEWIEFVEKCTFLETFPNKTAINPFTNEEIEIPGEGKAYFILNGERLGNVSLEEGELLTTGVPENFCNSIAEYFESEVFTDDRS